MLIQVNTQIAALVGAGIVKSDAEHTGIDAATILRALDTRKRSKIEVGVAVLNALTNAAFEIAAQRIIDPSKPFVLAFLLRSIAGTVFDLDRLKLDPKFQIDWRLEDALVLNRVSVSVSLFAVGHVDLTDLEQATVLRHLDSVFTTVSLLGFNQDLLAEVFGTPFLNQGLVALGALEAGQKSN